MAGQGALLKTLTLTNNWLLSNMCCRFNMVSIQPQLASIRTLKLETKQKLKDLKIPEKPKKPLTPYLQFVTEKRKDLVKDNPNLKATEVIKKLSTEWKSVNEAQKDKYKEKYLREVEKYDNAILQYNSNLSQEQVRVLEEANAEKKKQKQKRKTTKLNKETGKPKRPLGPYLLYLKEQGKIRNISHNELLVALKGEWGLLSETAKKKYRDEFEKEMVKYEEELLNWEKKMFQEGHKNVIRVKTLESLEHPPSRIASSKSSKQ
ncbi:unnamed protein product [Phyllotreta striolata]|uniref:HMG box domain-containing protein n=1 Tax=Phyllotreta striolata TaxID=444603 RepID=A0A9N9TJ02_PHYSR|nr:unnamed protein product [Phyllotreta striolata]